MISKYGQIRRGAYADEYKELFPWEANELLPRDAVYIPFDYFEDVYGRFPYRDYDYMRMDGRPIVYMDEVDSSTGGYVFHLFVNDRFVDYRVRDRESANKTVSTTTQPIKCFNTVKTAFKELYGISMKQAFGYSKELVNNIPVPVNEGILTDSDRGFYKIDLRSAYAHAASVRNLPTMTGAQYCDETVSPNADYPFAFYSDGGVAEYNDGTIVHEGLCSGSTTLLRMSSCSLAPIFQSIFASKEAATDDTTRQYYKNILNFFVGFCHKKSNPVFSALAAIIKLRCNVRVWDVWHLLEERGQRPVLINTDAVGWIGDPQPDLVGEGLGSFKLEYEDAAVIIRSPKRYQIKDTNGKVFTAWSGVKKEYTVSLPFGGIDQKPPASCVSTTWMWDETTKMFVKDEEAVDASIQHATMI